MGISRLLYGKFGEKVDLTIFMMGSGILCFACYLIAGLVSVPLIGLIGCAMCGFSVGIMWPGSISISSNALPTGGTAMFAILALAGDLAEQWDQPLLEVYRKTQQIICRQVYWQE